MSPNERGILIVNLCFDSPKEMGVENIVELGNCFEVTETMRPARKEMTTLNQVILNF